MSYVIGIDTSTTATKAVLIDGIGAVRGVASAGYDYQMPRPLWSEQDPRLWWDATVDSIVRVLRESGADGGAVEAVGLTGQMHGLVLLDDTGTPLRPAIPWNDQRTGAECDAMRRIVGKERLVALTGNDAVTGLTALKILRVRHHETEVFSAVRHVLLPKDYVRLQLTGEYAMDRAGGSGTQLFDLARRTWSSELLELLDLDATWFPPPPSRRRRGATRSSSSRICPGSGRTRPSPRRSTPSRDPLPGAPVDRPRTGFLA